MAGTKRLATKDLSLRPAKLRRVGHGDCDVSAAIRALSIAEQQAGSDGEEELLFLAATPEAVSAFDWSGLVGLLDAANRDIDPEDQHLIVDVPAAARRIPISRQLILKQIVDYLRIRVFGYGIVIESKDLMYGWVDMEVPSSKQDYASTRKKFYSDQSFDRVEAMEGACAAAIDHLRRCCFVHVLDINYELIQATEKKRFEAETWCMLLTHALDAGKSNNKAMRDAYSTFCVEAKELCCKFEDVFGVGTIGTGSTSSAPGVEKMFYNGPRPPITRAQELGLRLVNLINTVTGLDFAPDDLAAA